MNPHFRYVAAGFSVAGIKYSSTVYYELIRRIILSVFMIALKIHSSNLTCDIDNRLFVGEFFVGDLDRCLDAPGLRSFVGEVEPVP